MLSVAALYHRFGDLVAVDGIWLGVNPGGIVGLVGRNGAGKTTTMRAIMGILRPTGGAITWDGHPVTHADRQAFGYMPEERGLYPQMHVLEQVRYFARLHGLSARDASRAARTWLERLGLGDRGSDKLVTLSHGNQQRVQLAVALAHDPRLLVLDEPFSGLDPAAVDSLSEVLVSHAASGAGVLFSSHQLDLVERLCHNIVIVDHGRVLASGTLPDLRAQFPQHLRVNVDPPPRWAEWADGLAGVQVQREEPGGVLLLLEPGTDPQIVLTAALEAGTVGHFGFESGGLADLYRRLLAAA